MKRHSDALAVSDGASNPRAIIGAMKRAIDEMPEADTPAVCGDPALKLMAHQLCWLLNIPTGESCLAWGGWREACKKEVANG